jgi:potassium efflux system protein
MKRRTIFIATFLFAVAPALPAQITNLVTATTNAAPASPAVPAPPSNVIPESDLIARAQAILDKQSAPETDTTEASIRDSMATMEPKLPYLVSQADQLAAQNAPVETITTLEKWGDYFASTIGTKAGSSDGWLQMLSKRGDSLNGHLADLDQQRKTWDDTAAALKKDPTAAPEYAQQVAAVQQRLAHTRAEIVARQKKLRQLQQQVAIDATQVSNAMTVLAAARTRAISQLFQRNAEPIWSFEPQPAPETANPLSWPKQLQTLEVYASAEPVRFLIHLLVLAILLGVFWWLRGYVRRLTHEEPGIAPAAGIFETPISTALLIAIGTSPLIYYPIAPRLLSAVLGAVALVPCVLVLRKLIERRLYPILDVLVAFYFLEEYRSVAAMPPDGARAFLLAEILGAVCFLGWLLLALRRGTSAERFSRAVYLGARVAFVVLTAGWLAEILGFTQLANLLCVTVQRAATLALALYAGIRIIEAVLFIAMRLRPLSDLGMVRLHGPELLRRTQRILVWTAVVAWAATVFEEFPWAADVNARVFHFFARYDTSNQLILTTPGRILMAVLIGWGVFQISRFIRFALKTDFYPRMRLGAGVPYAISMTLHYVMLTVAFIAATAVLGIDMTKFTILVSALGVGVGFGLQNIINNFVSGLILLFERPIKIGDSVQTGDAAGVVERIGIRASILRTAGGTEIIVPNGSLISNNVTNWTLSSEERIIWLNCSPQPRRPIPKS